MTATKTKLILKDFRANTEQQTHTVHLAESRDIKVNLTRCQLDFFIEKWFKKTFCQTHESLIHFLNLYAANNIEATFPKYEYPDGHIRKIEGVSNSTLTRFKKELLGADHVPLGRKGVFGLCFHEMLLEPKNFAETGNFAKYNLRASERLKLKAMQEAIERDTLTQKILYHAGSNLENIRTWIDPITQLTCKGVTDIEIPKFSEVSDLKTTAAKSQKEYEVALEEYEYDRQLAFYTIGSKAKRIRVIGVQKIEPFNVFHVLYDRDSDFIKRGTRKVNFLLAKYKEIKLSCVV